MSLSTDFKLFFNTWIADSSEEFAATVVNGFANFYLTPLRYLFSGTRYELEKENIKEGRQEVRQITLKVAEEEPSDLSRCEKVTKTGLAALLLIPGLIGGTVLKGWYYSAYDTASLNHRFVTKCLETGKFTEKTVLQSYDSRSNTGHQQHRQCKKRHLAPVKSIN